MRSHLPLPGQKATFRGFTRRSTCKPPRHVAPKAVVAGAGGGDPFGQVERAVQVINRIIEAGSKGGGSVKTPKQKWVNLTAASTARVEADLGAGTAPPPGRSLTDFLALPVEEYSLLDPQWIKRAEGKAFVFTVPLRDSTGLLVEPQILITVDVDAEKRQVVFSSDSASSGDAALDARFGLQMRAVVCSLEDGNAKGYKHLSRTRAPAWKRTKHSLQALREGAPAKLTTSKVADNTAVHAGMSGSNSGSSASEFDSTTQPGMHEGEGQTGSSTLQAGFDFTPVQPQSVGNLSAAVELQPAPSASTDGATPLVMLSLEEPPASPSMQQGAANAQLATCAAGAEVERRLQARLQPHREASRAGLERQFAVVTSQHNPQHHHQQQHAELDAETAAAEPVRPPAAESGGGAVAAPQSLACRVDVRLTVDVPPPLNIVPGPLLSAAGSLVMKAALGALLPQFLTLLAADYVRWAGGSTTRMEAAAGSLVVFQGDAADS